MQLALKTQLVAHYGQAFDGDWQRLLGGYESDVWRVGNYVVRVSPAWRTDEEILWTHDLLAHCAQTIPQAIAPLKVQGSNTFFRWQGQPVTVYPFIGGKTLDLNNDKLIQQAARLLAQIHTASLTWPNSQPRPSQATAAPTIPDDQADPDAMIDPQLDHWYETVFQPSQPIVGYVHGDYYRANILCEGDQITGIIDWDESKQAPLITEVAWATWEFCHNATGDDLLIQRATLFLDAYRSQRDSLTAFDITCIIPLIRRHLRYEVRRSIADEIRGEAVDFDYRHAEIRAFHALRGRHLTP